MVETLKKNILEVTKLELKNPIMTASGTFGYADEYSNFISISKLGAIVTKAISLKPRLGNKGQRIFETYGGMINHIGLENIGIESFIQHKLPILKSNNIDFVINLAGTTFDEYIELANMCNNNKIKRIELNLSCPNVNSGCLEFGTTPEILQELVTLVRNVYKGQLIVKLTPNVTRIEDLGIAAQKGGADCISAINTLKGLGINIIKTQDGKFIKNKIFGGYSGKAIKPIALSMVDRLYKVLDIPIIGIGGISTFEDALEFFAVGAEAVQIGTANFAYPNISEKILNKIYEFIKKNNIESLDNLKLMLRED